MDPATIVGIIAALGSAVAMLLLEGASLSAVLLPAPMILVLGGTILIAMASCTLKDTIAAWASVPKVMTAKVPDPTEAIETLVALSEKARREGLLALEEAARGIEDEFLREGLTAAIDGTDQEDLRNLLENQIFAKRMADKSNATMFGNMGGFAPTVGIVGTCISLVHVLENLSNPEELGHMIAAAFVATLWGLLSSNFMWLPISNRIKRISELECAQMELIIEGLIALQSGASPRQVGERLRALLPPGKKAKEG